MDKTDAAAFERAVDDLHDAFVKELQALYDRWNTGEGVKRQGGGHGELEQWGLRYEGFDRG